MRQSVLTDQQAHFLFHVKEFLAFTHWPPPQDSP
jgi:hypothetical protein